LANLKIKFALIKLSLTGSCQWLFPWG